MKDFFSKKLNEREVPAQSRNKLLNAANLYLLAKEFGDLFGSNIPQVSKDIGETLSEKPINSKKKNDENT